MKIWYQMLRIFLRICSRVVEAAPNKVIVVSAAGTELGVQLRNQDMSWKEFLSTVHDLPRY